MLRASISSQSLRKAQADVRTWTRARKRAVQRVVNKTALNVESEAKQRAPVGVYPNEPSHVGGRLRASIARIPTMSTLTATVGTNVEYAPFVEFGTGRRGSESGVTPGDGYVYGSRAGMAAQPFLNPAIESNRRRFERDIAQALADTTKK